MTMLFLAFVSALALLAGAVLAVAMRRGGQRDVDRARLNVAIFRERRAELDAEWDAGRLDEAQHAALVAELGTLLVDDVAGAPAASPVAETPRGWQPLALMVAVPALALAVYAGTGFSPEVREWMQLQGRVDELAALPKPLSADAMSSSRLTLTDAARLTQATLPRRAQDADDWFALGITWMDLELPVLGVEAMRTANRLAPDNVDIAVTLARVEMALDGNRLNDAARALLDGVLAANPGHEGTLMIYGAAAFESGDYATAIARWEQLLAQVDPASEAATLLRQGIAKARASAKPVAAGAGIPVKVVLPAGADTPPADAVLFVIARVAGGPPMPVAAKKLPPRLPVEVTLTDADQMMVGAPLAARGPLEVLARISRSGTPMPASGDIASAPVRVTFPLDAPVTLTLDQRVP